MLVFVNKSTILCKDCGGERFARGINKQKLQKKHNKHKIHIKIVKYCRNKHNKQKRKFK